MDNVDLITPGLLATYNADDQKEAMEYWFRENFEDPAERTPYESAEGGYIWIWGGPYDASEELQNEFGDVVLAAVIDELVDELQNDCFEWAPTPRPSDYDEYLINDIFTITEFYQNYESAGGDIKKLLDTKVDKDIAGLFNRILYVSVVTILETYLSDAFIRSVMVDESLFRCLVETTPKFKNHKVPLSEIYTQLDELEATVKSYLHDISWHNLDKVSLMYKSVLKVEFPKELGVLYRAVLKRHDIVHRNGNDKNGNEISVTRQDIQEILKSSDDLVTAIDCQLPDPISDDDF